MAKCLIMRSFIFILHVILLEESTYMVISTKATTSSTSVSIPPPTPLFQDQVYQHQIVLHMCSATPTPHDSFWDLMKELSRRWKDESCGSWKLLYCEQKLIKERESLEQELMDVSFTQLWSTSTGLRTAWKVRKCVCLRHLMWAAYWATVLHC